jgi:hypothetical protein
MIADASNLGFGACYNCMWLQERFPPEWEGIHITVKEFYPILVLISMFGSSLRNCNVVFKCDNQAVCFIINKQTSKNKHVMIILRKLVLILIEYNINIRAVHIPGVTNILADRISRFQVSESLLVKEGMCLSKTVVPNHLQPKNFQINSP